MTFHIGDEVRQGRRIGTVTPLSTGPPAAAHMSIPKLNVIFPFGLSSVCHFLPGDLTSVSFSGTAGNFDRPSAVRESSARRVRIGDRKLPVRV